MMKLSVIGPFAGRSSAAPSDTDPVTVALIDLAGATPGMQPTSRAPARAIHLSGLDRFALIEIWPAKI